MEFQSMELFKAIITLGTKHNKLLIQNIFILWKFGMNGLMCFPDTILLT